MVTNTMSETVMNTIESTNSEYYTLIMPDTYFHGQQKNSSNYQFKNFSIDEGLSQSSVLSIYQDYKGFIWLGTRDGLVRCHVKEGANVASQMIVTPSTIH